MLQLLPDFHPPSTFNRLPTTSLVDHNIIPSNSKKLSLAVLSSRNHQRMSLTFSGLLAMKVANLLSHPEDICLGKDLRVSTMDLSWI